MHKIEEICQLHYLFTNSDTFQKTNFRYQIIKLIVSKSVELDWITHQPTQKDYSSNTISNFNAFKSHDGYVNFSIIDDTFKVPLAK